VVTLTYYVVVVGPLDDGTVIENDALLNYQGALTLGPVSTTIHSAPDLTGSSKTVDRMLATAGEEIEYTITLVNGGDMDGHIVWMTDTLPANVSYEDDLWCSHGAAAYADGVVTWTGPVDVDTPATIRYKVRLADTLIGGDVITNVATMDDGFAGHAPFEIGPAVTEIGYALSVSIDDGRDTVVPGELLTYTITFRGEDPVDDGKLTARIPDHTQFYAATGNYVPPSNGYVNWNLDPLGSNFEESVILVVLVDPVLPDLTVVENHVTFSGEGQSAQDDDVTTVTSSPDLSTSVKRVSSESAYGGDTLIYTIILSNTGTMNAGAVVLTDTIPEYTGYVVDSVSGGAYDPAAQAITWRGPLEVGESVSIQFSVVITELEFIPGGEYIRNVAQVDDGYNGHTVLSLQADTHIFSAERPDRYKTYLPLIFRGYSTPAVTLPDLVVTEILVTPGEPAAGEEVDIAVTIENQGTRAPAGCFWIDLYINPQELPIEVNKGWFDAHSDGGLVWSLCGLEPGESITLHMGDEHYWGDGYSQFAGSFGAPGTQTLYAQVDSWNPGVNYGAVYESDEGNNVYGPLDVIVTGGEGMSVGASSTPVAPPPRPALPSH